MTNFITALQHSIGWKFSDFVLSNIDMNNTSLSRRHRGLISDNDWHAAWFLTDVINARDGVASLHFSDGSTLSSHD